MKVKIEIELDIDYSNVHFNSNQIKDIAESYPEKIKQQINDVRGSLYFNGMALASVRCINSEITSYTK